MKKYQNFLSKTFHVLVVKFSVYVNTHGFVMNDSTTDDSFTVAFESEGNSLNISRKQIFRDVFNTFAYFIMKMYAVYIH